ncbi:hypothetical protein EVAR_88521_1 [Eumeta japonica]|uniref:Uncharacterized protein n=1 Tax=Eumeta variegata TaxID=151549 RepID=A0A4C1WK60_EUMVA|nr:hypothetical protein EVAR_88521_1 [Eumeta japonica]
MATDNNTKRKTIRKNGGFCTKADSKTSQRRTSPETKAFPSAIECLRNSRARSLETGYPVLIKIFGNEEEVYVLERRAIFKLYSRPNTNKPIFGGSEAAPEPGTTAPARISVT